MAGIEALASRLGEIKRSPCGPQQAARQTAEQLGLLPEIDNALGDIGHGRWAGRPIEEVLALEEQAFRDWLEGTSAAPGGESIEALVGKVGFWLDSRVSLARTAAIVVFQPSFVLRCSRCSGLRWCRFRVSTSAP